VFNAYLSSISAISRHPVAICWVGWLVGWLVYDV